MEEIENRNNELIKNRGQHGGDIYSHSGEVTDLSSNINPRSIPEEVYKSLGSILDKAGRYPDIEYRELKGCLRDYLRKIAGNDHINSEDILLGNGAVEIIDKTIASFDRIIVPTPSFVEYKMSALRYKKEFIPVEREFNRDEAIIGFPFIKKLLPLLCDNSLVVLCNPNNPDGAIYDIDAVLYLLQEVKNKNSMVMVDETFAEYLPKSYLMALSLLDVSKDLIVVKAITKFFGLPGVRLGYGITKNEDLKRRIIEKQTTWNVGVFAEEITKIMIKNEGYISNSKKDNARRREEYSLMLKSCNLFKKVFKSYSDFLTVELEPKYEAEKLISHLLEKGIIIRNLKNMPPFTERFFRIAVKDEAIRDKLCSALNTFLEIYNDKNDSNL